MWFVEFEPFNGSQPEDWKICSLEEVCDLSARVVVNQVSMRMENERITKLITDLKEALKE